MFFFFFTNLETLNVAFGSTLSWIMALKLEITHSPNRDKRTGRQTDTTCFHYVRVSRDLGHTFVSFTFTRNVSRKASEAQPLLGNEAGPENEGDQSGDGAIKTILKSGRQRRADEEKMVNSNTCHSPFVRPSVRPSSILVASWTLSKRLCPSVHPSVMVHGTRV